MRDSIPLDVCWDTWDTCGCGSLGRRGRRLSEEIDIDELSLKQLLPLFDQLAKAQTFYNIKKPARQPAKTADADRSFQFRGYRDPEKYEPPTGKGATGQRSEVSLNFIAA
eukprot:s1491_g7.t1